MKIQELKFDAFGPFTDRVLAFEGEGLHIVYGPNEAGKSSSLRGLKALLYGIDERTPDNHLHANDKLRISGRLRSADGEELTFIRRKGRKNTLLGPDGDALDEQVLVPFLHGVNSELFEMLFGIDHQALIRGGQEILEQKGEVGQALFSAALGSQALHTVLGQFDEEADGLFRPRGSTQKINAALKSYTQLSKAIRECSLSSREWEEKRRNLERTSEELDRLYSAIGHSRGEMHRLQRIQRVLPKLARRGELMQELQALGEVVILADDFTERRREAVHGLERAQEDVARLGRQLTLLREQLANLSINHELLERQENIEDLHARLGAQRKTQQERPHLEAERRQLLRDVEAILRGVRPELSIDDIETLRSIPARRQAIGELGNQRDVSRSRLEQADASRREVESRLKRVQAQRDEIPEPKSCDALRRAIASARKRGDMDAAIHSMQRELSGLQQQCDDALSRLPLWDGSLDEVMRLPVPGRATIERFEVAFDDVAKQGLRLEEKKAEFTAVLEETTRQLDEILLSGTVPTEPELVAMRGERNRAWHLLRRQWEAGEDVTAEAVPFLTEGTLADAFDSRMSRSDELSDRLRREAERVHALANLQAKQESLQQQIAALDRELAECAATAARLENDWLAEWAACRIAPRTPREMRGWLDELEKLRGRVEQLNPAKSKLTELLQIREQQALQLRQELTALGDEVTRGEEIEPLLLASEDRLHQLEDARHKRETQDRELKARTAELEDYKETHRLACAELETWQASWGTMMQSVGLRDDATPAEATEYIEQFRALFARQGDAEKLALRLKASNEDAETFRIQVTEIVQEIAPDLVGVTSDEAVVRLNTLLSEHRVKQSERKTCEETLAQVDQELQEGSATVDAMTVRLDALCREAKCDSRDELEEKERKSADYLRIRERIGLLEQEILDLGDGASLAHLEAEAGSEDADAIPACIENLSRTIDEELEPRRTELAETKGREQKELELMDGSDRAAELADEAQAVLAAIRTDAERYVRSKLAGRILRDQIERYRKENQGPLVKRASEHFAALTLGSFGGLMADFNEKDEPVLAGVRPNGDKVTVEGMSSGTRDQLYLALRLASLEKYMESSEPMPFIVDDVLVDFDDARSESALRAMAGLAEKTQVILFTHHSRVVEQAGHLSHEAKVTVHYL